MDRSDSFSQAGGQALKCRRTVQRRQAHIEQTKALGPASSFKECAVELFFGFYNPAAPLAENFRQTAVVPRPHIVVRTILHVTLRAVATVVQYDYDRVESITGSSGQF